MRIAIVSIAYSPANRDGLQRLFDALFEAGVDVHIYAPFHGLIGGDIVFNGGVSLFTDMGPSVTADYFFSVGGDGTLLRATQLAMVTVATEPVS